MSHLLTFAYAICTEFNPKIVETEDVACQLVFQCPSEKCYNWNTYTLNRWLSSIFEPNTLPDEDTKLPICADVPVNPKQTHQMTFAVIIQNKWTLV